MLSTFMRACMHRAQSLSARARVHVAKSVSDDDDDVQPYYCFDTILSRNARSF